MSVDEARGAEAAVRQRLAAAVTERARATREAERLEERARLAGADPRVAAAGAEQRRLAEAAGAEIDRLRAEVRAAEGRTAEAEAARDAAGGAPGAGA